MLAARSSETSEQTNGPTRSNNAEGYRLTFRNFHGDVINCFLNVQYGSSRMQRHAMRHLQWSSLATIIFFKALFLNNIGKHLLGNSACITLHISSQTYVRYRRASITVI